VIAGKSRRDWRLGFLVMAVVILLALITWDKAIAVERARVAEANAKTFAQEVQEACGTDVTLASDYAICRRADAVAAVPVDPATVAAGERGSDGVDGRNGLDGLPGLPGADGLAGTNGIDGLAGLDGTGGADGISGIDGLPGLNGANGAAGADGSAGLDGAPGRGLTSVVCTDSGDWLVTYSDATTSTTPGPCRIIPTPETTVP